MRLVLACMVLVFCADLSFAAVVRGTVYDLDLQPAFNAVVTVDSVPKQVYVASSSTYRFVLLPGNYTIAAKYMEGYSLFLIEESLTIVSDGEYTVDLLLFQDMSEEQSLLESEPAVQILFPENGDSSRLLVWGFVLLLAIALMAFFGVPAYRRSRAKIEFDSLPEEILGFVRKSGGRVTQKDIRKQFPMSEAKISLVLTDLEAKGSIQKIRKGKANIIVLKANQ